MVYTSESPALATLELLVQSGTTAPFPVRHYRRDLPGRRNHSSGPGSSACGLAGLPCPEAPANRRFLIKAGFLVLQVRGAVLPMQHNFS
jgi:hypothetical protein